MRTTRLWLLARLVLAGSLALPLQLSAEPYRLHPQDRLMIRVLIWDFSQNSMVGLKDLSGEYALSSEGMLQLPFVGEIDAGGLTESELGTAISDRLHRRAGLDEAPMLSVELVSSVPVYVLGHVETRGAVPFRPGLTVRQALALAGGVYRVAPADPIRAASFAAELRAAEESLARLFAERSSLEEELAQLRREAARETSPPGDAGPSPKPALRASAGATATAQERLQQANQVGRQIRTESYGQLREVLREKAERLNQQMELRDRQIAETRKELEGITSLNERGLAVNARVTSLSTALSEMETKRLELETALLLLEEQRNQADRDSSTLVSDAISDRLQRMVELEGLISAAELRRDSVRAQAGLLPADSGETSGESDSAVDFVLTRDGQTVPAEADTELMPGDTLDVVLPQALSVSQKDVP